MDETEHVRHMLEHCFQIGSVIPVKPLIIRDGVPVIYRGALNVITGAKKTYKSSVAACICAAALGGSSCDCIGFEAVGATSGTVMYVNAELPPGEFAEIARCIIDRSGLSGHPANLLLYSWETEPTADIRAATIRAIREKHVRLAVIDGIADLCDDFNNNVESRNLVNELLKAAIECDCSILCIIHTNPSSAKERGHLGTHLANKTSGYISLTRDSRQDSTVRVSGHLGTRGPEYSDFIIRYDDSIGGIICTDSPPPPKEQNEKVEYILSLFNEKSQIRYNELTRLIVSKFKIKKGSETTARRAIDTAREKGLIIRNDDNTYSLGDLPE